MKIQFSSSREKNMSHFFSRFSRDRDSCQWLPPIVCIDESQVTFWQPCPCEMFFCHTCHFNRGTAEFGTWCIGMLCLFWWHISWRDWIALQFAGLGQWTGVGILQEGLRCAHLAMADSSNKAQVFHRIGSTVIQQSRSSQYNNAHTGSSWLLGPWVRAVWSILQVFLSFMFFTHVCRFYISMDRFQQYYAGSGQLGIDRGKFNTYYKSPARPNVFLQTRLVTEIVTE